MYWVFILLVIGLELGDPTGNIIYSSCVLYLVYLGNETELNAIQFFGASLRWLYTLPECQNSNKVWTKDFMWQTSVKCEHITHLKYTLEFTSMFTCILNYQMSKGFNLFLFCNAFPPYEHTEYHGNILRAQLFHLLEEEGKQNKF